MVGVREGYTRRGSNQDNDFNNIKVKLLEKYFPVIKRNIKRKDFLDLVQGNMTVREYMTKLEHLSHFANNLIDTLKAKNQQYHQGLIYHYIT